MARQFRCALPRALLCIFAALVAGCGEGGGSFGLLPASPELRLVITPANAPAVAADALARATDVRLPLAVSHLVLHVASGAVTWTVAMPGVRNPDAASGAASAAGAGATHETIHCAGGGSLAVDKDSAGSAAPHPLAWGDTLTLTATDCRETLEGVETRMSGRIDVTVTEGWAWSAPEWNPRIAFSTVLREFTLVENGGSTVTANGDMAIRFSEDFGQKPCSDCSSIVPATQVQVTGAVLAATVLQGADILSWRLRDYHQQVQVIPGAITAPTTSHALDADVDSGNPQLGTGLVAYEMSAPQPYAHHDTGNLVAGLMNIHGNASSLAMSVPEWNVVSLGVDTQGDGVTDTTIATTPAELKNLAPTPK